MIVMVTLMMMVTKMMSMAKMMTMTKVHAAASLVDAGASVNSTGDDDEDDDKDDDENDDKDDYADEDDDESDDENDDDDDDSSEHKRGFSLLMLAARWVLVRFPNSQRVGDSLSTTTNADAHRANSHQIPGENNKKPFYNGVFKVNVKNS